MATTPTKDYYAILGIKKTATTDDIRKAFRKLARKHHPDVNPGDKKAEEKFKEISEANDVLSDEKKRKVYDALGYYSDQIDPAAAEAAARGGYGFAGGGPGGGSTGSQAGGVAFPTLEASTSPTTRPAIPANLALEGATPAPAGAASGTSSPACFPRDRGNKGRRREPISNTRSRWISGLRSAAA